MVIRDWKCLKLSALALFALLWTFASTAATAPAANSAVSSPRAAKDKNPRPRSGFVTSWDGARIHYIEAGRSKTPVGNAEVGNPLPPSVTITKGQISVSAPRQFPSILFVPGWTMPGWIWENQISHFSADYRVVAIDPRSQGESSKPCDGNYPASHARDIKAVIDQLHLGSVVLVGWSMGVTEIASYVDQFGTNGIAGIVLVDGVASFDLTADSFKNYVGFLKSAQTDRQKFTSDFVRSMYKKPQAEEYLQKVIKASLATPTDSAVAMAEAGFLTDDRPGLAKIDKPTVIVGATKGMLPLFQDMQKRIPGAKLEMLDDAGHALFVDDSDKFNILLDEFLTVLK
ncbi:MAG: alpha/beta fold hydrolase [Candidatus Acidiferrales bacterium]